MYEGVSVDKASLSRKRLCGGGPEESSFNGNPGRYVKSLQMRASLSVGAPFQLRGTWYVGGMYTGDFDG